MKKKSFEPQLVQATLEDYPTIQNMARFYVYDMSKECGFNSTDWNIPADGLYECFDFKEYFVNETRKAYKVLIDGELAGFVLLNHEVKFPKTDWNMGEFFILGKFQKKGVGRAVVEKVFKLHPGHWEVSVIPENQIAYRFWHKTISEYTKDQYAEEVIIIDYDPSQPKRILFIFFL
ncbi:GNAT family N-acetyltransferase [Legionella sp. WA2024007413]